MQSEIFLSYHVIVSRSMYEEVSVCLSVLKGHNTQHSGHTGQNEFMVEIYSKSLVGAIGKEKHQLKPIKVMN